LTNLLTKRASKQSKQRKTRKQSEACKASQARQEKQAKQNKANNARKVIPLPSFLGYDFKCKFISQYRVNELFSDSYAKIFCLSVSLHLSCTTFVISL